MKLLQEGNPLIRGAVRAGMSEPTARKYARSGQMPSEMKGATRTDKRTRALPAWPAGPAARLTGPPRGCLSRPRPARG